MEFLVCIGTCSKSDKPKNVAINNFNCLFGVDNNKNSFIVTFYLENGFWLYLVWVLKPNSTIGTDSVPSRRREAGGRKEDIDCN